MRRRDSATEMRSYRAALDRTGDITVGAYARRMRTRRIMLAGVGVLLTLAAISLYFLLRSDRGTPSEAAVITLRCAACGHEHDVPVDPARAYPVVCPACGERAAEPLWECQRCGQRFLPQVLDDGIVHCPRCGGTAVGRPHKSAANDSATEP